MLEHITNISPFLSYRYTSRLWLFLLLSLKPRPPTDTLMIKRKIQFFFSYERNSRKKEPRKLTTHKSTYIVRLLFLNQSRSTHRKAGHLEMVHRVDDIRLFPNWSISNFLFECSAVVAASIEKRRMKKKHIASPKH